MDFLFLASLDQDATSNSGDGHRRKHHASARPSDPRVLFLSFSGSASVGGAFGFWSKVGALLTPDAAISFSGWRLCGASDLEPHEGKENVAGIRWAGGRHSVCLAFA